MVLANFRKLSRRASCELWVDFEDGYLLQCSRERRVSAIHHCQATVQGFSHPAGRRCWTEQPFLVPSQGARRPGTACKVCLEEFCQLVAKLFPYLWEESPSSSQLWPDVRDGPAFVRVFSFEAKCPGEGEGEGGASYQQQWHWRTK